MIKYNRPPFRRRLLERRRPECVIAQAQQFKALLQHTPQAPEPKVSGGSSRSPQRRTTAPPPHFVAGIGVHYKLLNGPLAGLCVEAKRLADHRLQIDLSTPDPDHYQALFSLKEQLMRHLAHLPYPVVLELHYAIAP